MCRECQEIRYAEEARKSGLILNGYSGKESFDSSIKRNFTLPCGHTKDIRLDHVRNMRFECSICEESHHSKPSFVYLLKIETDDFSCLKFGYAKDIKTRIQVYCLKNAVANEVLVVPFPTGAEAHGFEQSVHRKYKQYKINKNVMKKFMKNGNTECYPIEMIDAFISEIKERG